jgi:predicted helicase
LEKRTGHRYAFKAIFSDEPQSVLPFQTVSDFLYEGDVEKHVVFTNAKHVPNELSHFPSVYCIKRNQLEKLTPEDFENIRLYLCGEPIELNLKKPQAHQKEAIQKITDGFLQQQRLQVHMACGTGKTLVALWAAQKSAAKRILILLPTLSLLRQFLHEWLRETSWNNFSFIAVCSDQSLNEQIEDEITLHHYELDFPVTTEAETISKFLKNNHAEVQLVFSTYCSAPMLAESLQSKKFFDLAIFDEAHKTVGAQKLYNFALKDENIHIQKRLFLTATPKHFSDAEGYSMADEKIYGPVAYHLSFKEATRRELICDYKVLISVITNSMLNDALLEKGHTWLEGEAVQSKEVAHALAIQQAVKKYRIKKIFTFHQTIREADHFSNPKNHDLHVYLENFLALHVNGRMNSTEREQILKIFEKSERALLSNARCLTEGIDVPAVDLVAFMHQKRSVIDIVQAAGRCMRKNRRNA